MTIEHGLSISTIIDNFIILTNQMDIIGYDLALTQDENNLGMDDEAHQEKKPNIILRWQM